MQFCSSYVLFIVVCTSDQAQFSPYLLVSYQVLGESLRITTDYLNTEEKVVVATLKAKSVEVECSKLRKDLINAMNEMNDANLKVKELIEALRMEKALIVQKVGEIQAALLKTDKEREKIIQNFKQLEEFSDLQFMQYFKGFKLLRRWTIKHHILAVDISNLDFEKIDTEILEDEFKDQGEAEASAMEKNLAANETIDEFAISPS